MRLLLSSLLLLMATGANASEAIANAKSQLPGNKISQFFPFGAAGRTSVFASDNGNVRVCAANESSCFVATVPAQVQLAKTFVPGPFIGNSEPSWIAYNDSAAYLCSGKKSRTTADCVKLGNYSGKDLDIQVKAAGPVPLLKITSNSFSADYVEKFAAGFTSTLKAAARRLSERASAESYTTAARASASASDEMSPMSEDMPIVEIGGELPPPDPGPGGIAVVPIGDYGGGGGSSGGDTGGGSGSTGCDTPGGASTNGSGPFSCPSKATLLQRCLDAAETMYYETYIPACNRVYAAGSRERAICYSDAMEQYVADQKYCRDYYAN